MGWRQAEKDRQERLKPEIWKPIPEFPGYELSNKKHLRRIIKKTIDLKVTNGKVSLYREGKQYIRSLSKLIKGLFDE